MTGNPQVAVDTSFVIAVLKGTVQSERSLGEVVFPFVVVGELRFGALGGRNPTKKLGELDEMVGRGGVLVADAGTAKVYAELRHRLKLQGTPLPENDVWIAATCLQHGLTLLTLDQHFDRIEGLSVAKA